MAEDVELMLLADVRSLESENARLAERIRKATQRLVELLGAEGPKNLEEMIDRVAHAIGEGESRLERQTDWYQQRFNRLRQWVNEEVKLLSEEVATRYFSICANGSPAPHESADWRETMHGLTLRAERAERELAALRKAVLDASVLRATCAKHEIDPSFRVHLRETEWDRIKEIAKGKREAMSEESLKKIERERDDYFCALKLVEEALGPELNALHGKQYGEAIRELVRERNVLRGMMEQECRNAEERGAYWTLKADARVIYSTPDNKAYWMLAREVCDKARKERGDDY